MLSGGTSTLPVAKSGLRWKLLLSTAAGPAATLLSGFLVLRLMPQRESFLAGVCQLFVAVSFFLGITNLLPIQHRGQMLDGMTLWILVFDKARRERLISMLDLVADVKQGKQIKSLKEYSLDRWASANDGTAAHVVANWAGYTDAKDSEVAGQHLEVCLASSSAISPEFRSLLILEAAKYQALRRNRVDLANAWLADDGEGKPEFGRYWAEAVILQHEGKWDDAIAKVEDALKYVKGLPESRAHTSQQQALTELRASLREQLGGSDPNVRS